MKHLTMYTGFRVRVLFIFIFLGLFCFLPEGDSSADGVTLLTHGWNEELLTKPVWLTSMRDDIAENFLKNEQNYGKITVTQSEAGLVATCNPWDFNIDTGTTGEVLIILDWSAVANHLTSGFTAQDIAAVVIDKLVEGQNGRRPLAELPIHLTGHSRGGGMVCELARLLGEQGIVVDHLTPLDPHPLTSSDPQSLSPVIDTPAAIYENVVFADVYSQTNAYPKGQYLAGGYNRIWGAMAGGYHDALKPFASHRNVYLMYQGTIDLHNPVNNGEAAMDATERAAWFNTYENGGHDTGFTYSRINGCGDRTGTNTPVAGGDEIRDGLHANPLFGGDGARIDLTWSNAVWPNVATLAVEYNSIALGHGTHSIPIGDTLELKYVYLDCDSDCTVTLHADADRNPYNDNDICAIGTPHSHSTTGETYAENTLVWDTTGMSDGTSAALYARVTDGTRTRYLYAPPIINFIDSSAISSILLLLCD